MKVTHDGRRPTNRRSHVGRSRRWCRMSAARCSHGRIVKDLVVMLADGGDCLADLAAFATRAPGSLGRVGLHGVSGDPSDRQRPTGVGGRYEGGRCSVAKWATGTRRGAVPRRGRHHNCNARGAAPTVRRTGPMHSHDSDGAISCPPTFASPRCREFRRGVGRQSPTRPPMCPFRRQRHIVGRTVLP